jgi:ech hydrogenase subunit D
MTSGLIIECIEPGALRDRAQQLRDAGFRMVQVGAARLPEAVEVTYSFDLHDSLHHLRVSVPADSPRLPSVSSIYPCVVLYENEIHDLFGVEIEGLALDFHGNLYKMAVKFPFGSPRAPAKAAVSCAPPEASSTQ